jgi:DNA-binding transcriptional LysR family regulator
MSPELRHLRCFVAVAEERSFTRAAQRLHLAQQAVSSGIKQLESELGVQLLVRTTRSVALTQAGAALLEQGRTALDAMELAFKAATQADGRAMTLAPLAYDPVLGHGFVTAAHGAIARNLSRVHVAWRPRYNVELGTDVLAGRFLAGVGNLPELADGLSRMTLSEQRLGLLMGASHRFARREHVDITDLEGETIVTLPRDLAPRYHDELANLYRAAGFEPRLRETPDPDGGATLQLYVRCEAVATAPITIGQEYAARNHGWVVFVPFAEGTPRVRVEMVWRTGSSDPLVQELATVFRGLASYGTLAAGGLDSDPYDAPDPAPAAPAPG